jgi:hypothetical protein
VAVLDLIGNAANLTQAWTPLAWRVLGVDLTGIALAIIFACMARAAARRARTGDAHSVWAMRTSTQQAIN